MGLAGLGGVFGLYYLWNWYTSDNTGGYDQGYQDIDTGGGGFGGGGGFDTRGGEQDYNQHATTHQTSSGSTGYQNTLSKVKSCLPTIIAFGGAGLATYFGWSYVQKKWDSAWEAWYGFTTKVNDGVSTFTDWLLKCLLYCLIPLIAYLLF